MQDAILAELENCYQDSRKDKDDASRSMEDLLVPNPNHATDDASDFGEEGEE